MTCLFGVCCVVWLVLLSYIRLETKSHELSSIFRGMAARLEDMQAASRQQQSTEVDAPRERLAREEADAAESRRRSAVQAPQLEKERQATKWRELLSAIERENELQLEAMLLRHKEAVDTGIRSITQHIAGTCPPCARGVQIQSRLPFVDIVVVGKRVVLDLIAGCAGSVQERTKWRCMSVCSKLSKLRQKSSSCGWVVVSGHHSVVRASPIVSGKLENSLFLVVA